MPYRIKLCHRRHNNRILGIGPEIRVIPVGMRKIERDTQTPLAAGFTEFLHYVALERCLHDRVREVAILQFWPIGAIPSDSLFNAGPCIEHREALMMLCGESEHAYTVFRKQRGP